MEAGMSDYLCRKLAQRALRLDCKDKEIVKAVLETFVHLCDVSTDTNAKDENNNLGIQFTEIFVKDPGNVHLLLDRLEEEDFHVRYNAIEFLKVLLKNKKKQLQDCILTSPMGVSRLMDLLGDGHEAIRNETLVLLIDLTHQNPDIQKIIAFENAFERLLQIIEDEGGAEGDVIVQDCLELIQTLLKDNVSNQNYFRESGLMLHLGRFFSFAGHRGGETTFFTFIESEADDLWSPQKMRNITLALRLIQGFASGGHPNVANNQKVIAQSRIFHSVLQLALARNVPQLVRAGAMYVMSYCISGNQELQDFLGQCILRDSETPNAIPIPVINEIVYLTVTTTTFTKPDFLLRASSACLMQNYLLNNYDAQNVILKTLTPPPASNPNDVDDTPQSAGSLLLGALLDWEISRKDPFRSWFAALILSYLVYDNTKCKELALDLEVSEKDGDGTLDLLTTCSMACMVCAREGADIRVQIGFLCFLSTWLHNFPAGVQRYLEEASNFSFLIEQISQSSVDPVVQGLAAFLLGICFDANDDQVPGLTRAAIQSIVISRIGSDQYVNCLNRLRDSQLFGRSSLDGNFEIGDGKTSLPDIYFDTNFVDFFKSVYEILQNSVVNPKALQKKEQQKEEAAQHESIVTSYKGLIAQQDQEIAQLRNRVKELEVEIQRNAQRTQDDNESHQVSEIATSPIQVPDIELQRRDEEIERLRSEKEEWKTKYETAQQELEDLLVCLAEQDEESQKFKDRLRALGQDVDDEEEATADGE